jgi:PD-(D/E)XK nuclease superfamily
MYARVMTDQFAPHGITHLSPSSCNMFAASPAAFVMERLLKKRSPVGVAAHRGTAVEAGIAKGLLEGAPLVECVKEAEDTFGRLAALSGDPRKEREREALADMVDKGLDELLDYGKPSSAQGKVQLAVDGLPVPVIGFYDFEWADHGIILDLKTTHALPSKISTTHARQVALYSHCRGMKDARLCYVTSKKSAVYTLENVDDHLRALMNIARSIAVFLSKSEDPMELAKMVVPDVDTFWFSDPIARKAAFEIWGI